MARFFRILGIIMLAVLIASVAGWLTFKVFSGKVDVEKPATIAFGIVAPIIAFLLVVGLGHLLYTRRVALGGWSVVWRIVKSGIALFFVVILGIFLYSIFQKDAIVQPRVISLDAGQIKSVVWTAPGTYHKFKANKPWIGYCETEERPYVMPAGWSSWLGANPKDFLMAKGLRDGTVIEVYEGR